ncbi:MAG: enoyl-CoA hydratase/isomerase family protein, partial [Candidatus Eremiobacteraeota bacterium]|nr:enoyl-CoA hydratase/isomerase family protein [Candidatus Eremiobacteraeota bacterium]
MIRIERRDAIAVVTFDRPAARNAMTFAMWETLRREALGLAADAALRAVVFTGADGRAFVSGTDIAEFLTLGSGADGIAYEHRIEAAIDALERIPVPTVAAIAGACTGGGASIAGACDLRIGAPSARVGIPIARTLGNCLSQRNVARLAALIGLDR